MEGFHTWFLKEAYFKFRVFHAHAEIEKKDVSEVSSLYLSPMRIMHH